jgi:predicted nuclease of predicted toxin-antitoxin system
MPKTIRLHLDEHVNSAIAAGLRRHGIDVTTTSDAGLIGQDDIDHVTFARAEGRVRYTSDSDFLDMNLAGIQQLGIVYCHQQKAKIGTVVRGLILICEMLEPEEMHNRVEYL